MNSKPNSDGPQSVKEIWESAILRFQQRTGYALGSSASQSPEDLQKALDLHYEQQQQAGDERAAKAKAMGLKIINCIQLLGGMVADGVSGVFAPAPVCFQALSFLLDIPRKIHEFHEEINSIFEEVGPALAQFRIYRRMDENTGIDEILRASICEVMASFMDICANCINIQKEGKWKSLKRNAKRILLDDSSVQSEIDNFKKLTQRQLNAQSTLTLEAALEIRVDTRAIRTDVSGLVETDQKRTLDETRRKHLTTIKTKLGLKPEQTTRVLDERDTLWKNSIDNSGKWLNDLEKYREWMDGTGSENLLLLTGGPGTGKSHLVSAICYEIKEIKSRNSTSKSERSLMAYYSFSLAAKENKRRPETAVKIICAQLAEQDSAYAKHVATICGEKDESLRDTVECKDLWKTLAIDSPARNASHYVILDSADSLESAELERLIQILKHKPTNDSAEEERGVHVRILVTGDSSILQSAGLDVQEYPTIDITEHNTDDIRLFIEKELQNMGLFQGEDEDSKRLRSIVQDRLLARSNNNYLTVRQDLEKVEDISTSSGTEEELVRVLQESNAGLEESVKSDIEALEATLKPREIDEINELLIWACVGQIYFNFEELSAALFLRFKTVPLQPLSQKVTRKYSKLFTLVYGNERLAVKDLVEKYVVAHRDRRRESADDPKITATITISNVNVKAAQRFVWDLNHHSFLDGFSFNAGSQFYDTIPGKIQIYAIDAHFEIVKRAFELFNQPYVDDRTKAIGYYLMSYIPDHLQILYEATDFDELPEKDKQYIGTCITEMFSAGDWIERTWEYRSWTAWYRFRSAIDIFWKWLDDPVATSHLGALGKGWIAGLKNAEDRNQALLTPMMMTIARHWLQEDEWDPVDAAAWIRGFLEMGDARTPPKDENDGSETGGDESSDNTQESQNDNAEESDDTAVNESIVQKIERAEEWCKQILKVDERDYLWRVRLGITLARSNENSAAVEQYIQVARMLESEEPIDKEKLYDVYKSLGNWSTDAETALEYYKKALEQMPCAIEIEYAMCKRYIPVVNTAKEAQPLINQIVSEKVSDPESSPLFFLLNMAASDSEVEESFKFFMALISFASSSPEQWPVVESELESLIEHLREEGQLELVPGLLLVLGISVYHFREQNSTERLRKAVASWRECLDILHQNCVEKSWSQDRAKFTEWTAASYLSMAYFEQQDEVPAEVFKSNWIFSGTKYVVASHYTLCGQQSVARNLLRSELVEAFNILCDDDVNNDTWGFLMLFDILDHTGDYEKCREVSLLSPSLKFDREVLHTLLISEDGNIDEASQKILDFYEENCPDSNEQIQNLRKVLRETERLLEATSSDNQEGVSPYKAILDTLSYLEHMDGVGAWCDNCGAKWGYETTLLTCKRCYNTDLCDACLEALRSEDTTVFTCNKAHDWWDRGVWTMEKYIWACKRLVKLESGEFVTTSKWLGDLCEEWGLSKADWDFA